MLMKWGQRMSDLLIVYLSFSLVNILLAVSTVCLNSYMGNRTQYNFVGSVFFWILLKFVVLHSPKSVATCHMHSTYESNVSVFSSKWTDCHVWNSCSLVFPIFEYCCLNWFCKPWQSTFIGLRDSYHNLASPTNDWQNLWTFPPSWNWCVSIQSFILSRCASAYSSGFPEYSG